MLLGVRPTKLNNFRTSHFQETVVCAVIVHLPLSFSQKERSLHQRTASHTKHMMHNQVVGKIYTQPKTTTPLTATHLSAHHPTIGELGCNIKVRFINNFKEHLNVD